MRLILASASPRRRELLHLAGFNFEVQPANIDEQMIAGEDYHAFVRRLAVEKAAAIAGEEESAVVLAADTVVVLEDDADENQAGFKVLGKPVDRDDAFSMLKRLQGRKHKVVTGFCLFSESLRLNYSEFVSTDVWMSAMSDEEIIRYIETKEPLDKAGAYAIQGKGMAYVTAIKGSYSNVIGLPLPEVITALKNKNCYSTFIK